MEEEDAAGDREREEMTGDPALLGLGMAGGLLSDDGEASPMVAAAADNRDLRKSRADERAAVYMLFVAKLVVLATVDLEIPPPLPALPILAPALPAADRCSFLFCKIAKAAFNSFAPPDKLCLRSWAVREDDRRRRSLLPLLSSLIVL